jgi:hypothetical protein
MKNLSNVAYMDDIEFRTLLIGFMTDLLNATKTENKSNEISKRLVDYIERTVTDIANEFPNNSQFLYIQSSGYPANIIQESEWIDHQRQEFIEKFTKTYKHYDIIVNEISSREDQNYEGGPVTLKWFTIKVINESYIMEDKETGKYIEQSVDIFISELMNKPLEIPIKVFLYGANLDPNISKEIMCTPDVKIRRIIPSDLSFKMKLDVYRTSASYFDTISRDRIPPIVVEFDYQLHGNRRSEVLPNMFTYSNKAVSAVVNVIRLAKSSRLAIGKATGKPKSFYSWGNINIDVPDPMRYSHTLRAYDSVHIDKNTSERISLILNRYFDLLHKYGDDYMSLTSRDLNLRINPIFNILDCSS